jgi:adenine phosphoribosyltransferase
MRMDWFEKVRGSFSGIPIVVKGEYQYFVHPLSDGIPLIDPELLGAVADEMARMVHSDIDVLLTAEAMGIPLITAISERSGIPYSVVRKRRYGIENELSLRQVTGYSENDLYMNLPPGKHMIAIIDDVLSTGGTIRAMVGGLRAAGCEVHSIIVFADKMTPEARGRFQTEIGCGISTLVHVDVIDGRCIVKRS